MSLLHTRPLTKRRLLAGLGASSLLAGLAPRSGLAQAAPPGPSPAPATPPISIAFIGDSMVDGLWGGMERLVTREPCLSASVKLLRFGENGSGLTRPARFDWIARAKAVVAQWKPTLSIVSLGLNDRQSIVDGAGRFDLGTAAWRKHYAELVAHLAVAAAGTGADGSAGGGAGTLWIGLPALRDAASQADAAEKNAIFAEAIAALNDPRIAYLAPWRQGGPEGEAFQPYGPDLDGSRVQIRAGDGIHFTAAGYDVLTRYVFERVVDRLKSRGVSIRYPCGG